MLIFGAVVVGRRDRGEAFVDARPRGHQLVGRHDRRDVEMWRLLHAFDEPLRGDAAHVVQRHLLVAGTGHRPQPRTPTSSRRSSHCRGPT